MKIRELFEMPYLHDEELGYQILAKISIRFGEQNLSTTRSY